MKIATIFALDCCRSMNEPLESQEGKSFFDISKLAIARMLHERLLAGRKTDEVGIVMFGCSETDNHLANDGEYENIKELMQIRKPELSDLHLFWGIKSSENVQASDCIDALIVSVDMILEKCKKYKYQKRVYIFTDGKSAINKDGIEEVAVKIKEENVQISIVCVGDLDDSQETRENKDFFQEFASEMLEGTESVLFDLDDLQDSINSFHKKSIAQTTLFKGTLSFAHHYEIPISVCSKTHAFSLPSFGKVYKKSKDSTVTDTDDMVDVVRNVKYKKAPKDNEDVPSGGEEYAQEDLVKAYFYGSTAVVAQKVDEKALSYNVPKGLSVVAFLKQHDLDRVFFMGSVYCVYAQPDDSKAKFQLAALVSAMIQTETILLARYVRTVSSDPKIVALFPVQLEDFQGLLMVQLPFRDDRRDFSFSSLPAVCAVKSEDGTITLDYSLKSSKGRFPSDTQLNAMKSFVEAMDGERKAGMVGEGDEEESLYDPEDIYFPTYHYMSECVLSKALNPEADLPAVNQSLLRQLEPMPEMLINASKAIETLQSVFHLTKETKKGEKKNEVLSDRNMSVEMVYDEIFKKSPVKKQKVETVENDHRDIPILNEFLSKFDDRTGDQVSEAVSLFAENIIDMLTFSPYNDQPDVETCLHCIKVLRSKSMQEDESMAFNHFLRRLKESGDFGDLFPEPWSRIKEFGILPITMEEAPDSNVTAEQASKFWHDF